MDNFSNTDLRVIKTRKLIREAFFSLLQKKGIDEIQIQEISSYALIARQTFYQHYKNKIEIIEDYISHIFKLHQSLVQKSLEDQSFDAQTGARIAFDIWEKESKNLLALIENKQQELFTSCLKDYIETSIDMYIALKIIEKPHEKIRPYISDFISGGFYNLLVRWINQDCQPSSDTMAALISDILSSKEKNYKIFPKGLSADLNIKDPF